MVVLPSSFTGGPRYMHERAQDAMTYVRNYSRPDLFITFTCNPKWDEIKTALFPDQKPHERHDIVARVFRLKLKALMDLLTKGCLFGPVRCFMYTVEWQKRGLPHAHILIWLEKRITPDCVDQVICSEIPDPDNDPILHGIVKTQMMHGPCGVLNPNSVCMKDAKCTKKFPRSFVQQTETDRDGYPLYQRRSPEDGGFTVEVRNHKLDNRWVVPYNPVLLRSFNAHINVEYCHSVKSIKYICKYVTKGTDQATISLQNEKDEVAIYESGRYISSSEATWRILTFPIHESHPTIVRLAVHLENGQRVYFTADTLQQRLSSPPKTTLTGFFSLCESDEFAKTLLYPQVAAFFVWNNNTRKFTRRKVGSDVIGWPGVKKDSALGRVYTVHPLNTECFYLRILLHHVRGPTSFNALKTVDRNCHPTYQAACLALGLLDNDNQWFHCLFAAAQCLSAQKIRDLFVVILVFCQPSDPLDLWSKFKGEMTDDIVHRMRARFPAAEVTISLDDVYNRGLIMIEDSTLECGGKRLPQYGLPLPIRNHTDTDLSNLCYVRETSYDQNVLQEIVSNNERSLTIEQFDVYRKLLNSINNESSSSGKIFFLDAPGGTGKTFLINLLLAKVRSENQIALAVASSGIAATLLQGGKTAHSAFKLPFNLHYAETPVCNISKQSGLATLLRKCKLIVWDEITMAHKGGVEALFRSLQDIRGNKRPMGGVTVLLAGDFRQTLPIVPRGTRADQVKASIKASYLWPSIVRLTLTTNMRVHIYADLLAGQFSELLLQIGNGELQGEIAIPQDLCTVVSTIDELIAQIYPEIECIHNKNTEWLRERAILTPKNDQASAINRQLLESFDAPEMEYISVDSVVDPEDAVRRSSRIP